MRLNTLRFRVLPHYRIYYCTTVLLYYYCDTVILCYCTIVLLLCYCAAVLLYNEKIIARVVYTNRLL